MFAMVHKGQSYDAIPTRRGISLIGGWGLDFGGSCSDGVGHSGPKPSNFFFQLLDSLSQHLFSAPSGGPFFLLALQHAGQDMLADGQLGWLWDWTGIRGLPLLLDPEASGGGAALRNFRGAKCSRDCDLGCSAI